MIPVKKTINPNNTNSRPWLLCPSKSIPGKFYYFNGATGDAVWTISDVDKPKKDAIHRITDKAHSYPEPISPPNDESTNTTNSFSSTKNVTPEFPNNTPKDINPGTLPAPTFGQAVFSKYVTDAHTSKVIWAFTPLYLPEQLMQQHRETMDRITQTYESNPIFVQNPVQNPFQNVKRTLNFVPEFQYNQTLTQNVKEPIFTFGQTPTSQTFKEPPIFGKTPAYNPFKAFSTPMFVPKQREACETFVPIQRRVKPQSESYSTPKSVLKASRSVENPTSLFNKDVEPSTVSPEENKADKLSKLSKNDLRFLLVAKKTKGVSDEVTKSTDQSIKTQESVTPKKRVTFDLQQPKDPNSEDSAEIDQSLNSLHNPSISEGLLWYVVTDTSVLLSQIHSLEQFVKKDPCCRLLIPYAVYKDVEALNRGDCGVMSARQLLRRLGVAAPHIVVQSKPEYEHASSEDSILQCCWDLMQGNCRVILITDNKTIMNKAKSIHLECHTLEKMTTMKENRKPTHTPTEHLNEIRNMKIIVSNDKKKSENLFAQDFSEINNFPFSKSNGYSVKIDQSKTNMFSAESTDGNEIFSKKDANSDKLVNLTRRKNLNAKTCELTNVNDKILNLSITEKSTANNRTKQILQNVFRNTEVNKINQDKTFVFDHKNKSNQNLSEINKVTSVNQNNYEISNETNLHIRNLKVTENNPVRAKDNIKVSGITKLNTHFNLDGELERFYVKNIIIENRIKSRLDEWICRLNQTMEGVLTDVLLKEKVKVKKLMPPWNLFEAIQLTGEAFKKQHNIKTIVDRFSMKHLICTSKNEKNMKPNDVMNFIGLGMILIQNLKEIVNYKELYEADDMISDLIKDIENPNTDMDFALEKVNTRIFIRSEIPEPKIPIPFKKNDAEVIGYLKKHFETWKSYEVDSPKETNVDNVETTTVNNKEPNVVRTFGKNLNMLKINSSKTITMEETDKVNIEPKVIRNVTCIEAFEEKLKQKQELYMNKLDYDESLYTIPDASDDIEAANIYKVTDEKSNDLAENNIEDLDSVSSELDAECVQAYPLVKIFLVKLKRTFFQIYCFINDSMKEYQKGMTLEKKKDVKLMTEMAHGYVLKITRNLKNIIARESGNGMTLKHLLIKAGDYVENDKVIGNYKNVIAQYLKQAETLEEALSILLSLSNADKKEREGYTGTFKTFSPIENKRVFRSNQMVIVTKEV